MKNKFFITRLERSSVVKKVQYVISASNKEEAIRKLSNMSYEYREAIDEIQEDNWKPQQLIEITPIVGLFIKRKNSVK